MDVFWGFVVMFVLFGFLFGWFLSFILTLLVIINYTLNALFSFTVLESIITIVVTILLISFILSKLRSRKISDKTHESDVKNSAITEDIHEMGNLGSMLRLDIKELPGNVFRISGMKFDSFQGLLVSMGSVITHQYESDVLTGEKSDTEFHLLCLKDGSHLDSVVVKFVDEGFTVESTT